MIVFAFSLAFFLGREVTLSGQQKSKKINPSPNLKAPISHKDNLSPEGPINSQREKVNKYKKTLIHEQSEKKIESTKQPKAKTEIKNLNNEVYALFVASYEDKESATETSTQLKLRFPKWEIFFKRTEEVYKVYIGPFKTKKSAENFLKELQKKPEFSTIKLETI